MRLVDLSFSSVIMSKILNFDGELQSFSKQMPQIRTHDMPHTVKPEWNSSYERTEHPRLMYHQMIMLDP